MLHYNPRHVSSINMPISRRTNCVITASGIVALCKWLHSMPSSGILCSTVEGLACFAVAGGCVGAKGNLACCSSGPLNLLCGAGNVKLDALTGE